MRKYLLGIIAVVAAITFSAFTPKPEVKKSPTPYYWFQVKPGFGAQDEYDNSEVTIIPGGLTDVIPAGTDCGTGNYNCVVGFNQNQLVSPAYTQLDGSQEMQALGRDRPGE